MSTRHEDCLIDLVNDNGDAVDCKPRKEVDKSVDLYHAVYILVITPAKELVLSKIPHRNDLPNLYADRLGLTVATIRRHNETKDAAATRALAKEIHTTHPKLNYLGDRLAILSDGHKTYLSAYYIINEIPKSYSQKDIQNLIVLKPRELEEKIAAQTGVIAPTLEIVWKSYKQQLPV